MARRTLGFRLSEKTVLDEINWYCTPLHLRPLDAGDRQFMLDTDMTELEYRTFLFEYAEPTPTPTNLHEVPVKATQTLPGMPVSQTDAYLADLQVRRETVAKLYERMQADRRLIENTHPLEEGFHRKLMDYHEATVDYISTVNQYMVLAAVNLGLTGNGAPALGGH